MTEIWFAVSFRDVTPDRLGQWIAMPFPTFIGYVQFFFPVLAQGRSRDMVDKIVLPVGQEGIELADYLVGASLLVAFGQRGFDIELGVLVEISFLVEKTPLPIGQVCGQVAVSPFDTVD